MELVWCGFNHRVSRIVTEQGDYDTDEDSSKEIDLSGIQQSINHACDQADNDAKADVEWIQLSNHFITQHINRLKSYWAIGIGIICLVIIGLVFTIHVRSTNVSIEILADGLTISFADGWQSQKTIIGGLFNIDKVTNVSSSLQPELFKSSHPSSIEFTGKNIELKNIKVQKNAEIDIQCFKKELSFYIKKSNLSGKLSMRKGTVRIDETFDSLNISSNRPKTTYTFHSNQAHTVSDYIRLDIGNVRELELNDFAVNKLTFLVENPPGSGIFESTLQQGKIVLYDTRDEIDILEKENLLIEFKDCQQTRLFLKDDKICIKFIGKVTKLMGGLKGFSKNYKPTYLEYFYNNQRLALFWSTLVFLFGIIWSIKNTIFNK